MRLLIIVQTLFDVTLPLKHTAVPNGTKLSYIGMNPGHQPGAANNDTP